MLPKAAYNEGILDRPSSNGEAAQLDAFRSSEQRQDGPTAVGEINEVRVLHILLQKTLPDAHTGARTSGRRY